MARKKPKFFKISSNAGGEESCVFCERPHTGHLVTEFSNGNSSNGTSNGNVDSGLVRGVAISVCDFCEKVRKGRLQTGFA